MVRRRAPTGSGSCSSLVVVVMLPDGMVVLVLDHDRRRAPPPEASEPGDEERAATRHARALSVANGGDDHEHAERDERHADETFHDLPDRLRQVRGREDDGGPDRKGNRRVPQRVERGEHHRAAPALLRRGDVAQRREVVPVEPVTEPERERGRDEADLQPRRARDHCTAHESDVTPVTSRGTPAAALRGRQRQQPEDDAGDRPQCECAAGAREPEPPDQRGRRGHGVRSPREHHEPDRDEHDPRAGNRGLARRDRAY